MKLKQLVQALEEVPRFPAADYELEQYKTSAALAAEVLWRVASHGDLEGKLVADLGCGTGIFSIGAVLMGAGHVVGFDIDPTALAAAKAAAARILGDDEDDEGDGEESVTGEPPGLDFVNVDILARDGRSGARGLGLPLRRTRALFSPGGSGSVSSGPVSLEPDAASTASSPAPPSIYNGCFDTVLMNPPFGTRRVGADVGFLNAAFALLGPEGVVYSIHKSSTRAHLARVAAACGLGMQLLSQVRFTIPATYAFHRAEAADVDVDVLRFVKGRHAAAVIASHSSLPAYVPDAAAAATGGGSGGGGTRRGGGSKRR